MAKKADIGGKRLIGLSPNAWVQWAMEIPNIKVRDIISADFQWIGRESDVLLRASHPHWGDFLVLNELRTKSAWRNEFGPTPPWPKKSTTCPCTRF